MDERGDRERDARRAEPREKRPVLEHNVHDEGEEGRPPVAAPGARDAAGRAGRLQPLVPAGRAGRVEPGPLRSPPVYGL